jgi:hypothetical protein
MTIEEKRCRRYSPAGVLGVSPIFINSPKIGGYRGLINIWLEETSNEECNTVTG